MNRRLANTIKLLFLALSVVLFLLGCEMSEESPTPIFAGTKFMGAYYSEDSRFEFNVDYYIYLVTKNTEVQLFKDRFILLNPVL